MDNLTHTLFAATLARTPLGRAGRGTAAALILASNAPDIDFVASAGGGMSYLEWHRGPTHGPLGVIGLGLATAALVFWGIRVLDGKRGNPASLASLSAISMLGVLLHILMDLPTVYGTRLLSPFSGQWYSVDWMPIIDVYLWVILLGGALVDLAQRFFYRKTPSALLNRWRYRNAVVVLTVMALNYALHAGTHRAAVASAPEVFGPSLPPLCDESRSTRTRFLETWSAEIPPPHHAPDAPSCLIEIAAIPSFTSAFEWRLLARLSNAYEAREIDLLSPTEIGAIERYPDDWDAAALAAARDDDTAAAFLRFARFPAAHSIREEDGTARVQWTDLRFTSGPPGTDVADRRRNFFTATARVRDGQVISAQSGQ